MLQIQFVPLSNWHEPVI